MKKIILSLVSLVLMLSLVGVVSAATDVEKEAALYAAAKHLADRMYDPSKPAEFSGETWSVIDNAWEATPFEWDDYYNGVSGTEHPGSYALAGLVVLKAYQRDNSLTNTNGISYLELAKGVGNYLKRAQDKGSQYWNDDLSDTTSGGVIVQYRGEPWRAYQLSHNAKAMVLLAELYQETGDSSYLTTAEEIAAFLINNFAVNPSDYSQGFYRIHQEIVNNRPPPLNTGTASQSETYYTSQFYWALAELNEISSLDYSTVLNALGTYFINNQDPTYCIGSKYKARNFIAEVGLRASGYTTAADTLASCIVGYQQPDGSVPTAYTPPDGRSQGIAAIALCDASRSEAENTVDFLISIQTANGGIPSAYGGTDKLDGTGWGGLAFADCLPPLCVQGVGITAKLKCKSLSVCITPPPEYALEDIVGARTVSVGGMECVVEGEPETDRHRCKTEDCVTVNFDASAVAACLSGETLVGKEVCIEATLSDENVTCPACDIIEEYCHHGGMR